MKKYRIKIVTTSVTKYYPQYRFFLLGWFNYTTYHDNILFYECFDNIGEAEEFIRRMIIKNKPKIWYKYITI